MKSERSRAPRCLNACFQRLGLRGALFTAVLLASLTAGLVDCHTPASRLSHTHARFLKHLRFLEADSDDASGPVVKDSELPRTRGSEAVVPKPVRKRPARNATSTFAELIDQALKQEFSDETSKAHAVEAGKSFNTSALEDAVLETVMRISSKVRDAEDAAGAAGHNVTRGAGGGAGGLSGGGGSQDEGSSLQQVSSESAVDRIIDNKNNEFVLSRVGSDPVASLLVDPQLIQDITAVLATCAAFGIVFETIQQPVINGYLVAGAVLGPGGLEVIKELVQVESLAQIGVQLLLFSLGMELSMSKLRAVYGVAIFGGCLQILLSMFLTGTMAAFGGMSVSQGVFIGALLSMSSTSVVVKCLETTRSTNSMYGQITIGTLILQDCCVGIMFALLPVFRPSSAGAQQQGHSAENRAAIILMVLQVLFKLAAALALAAVMAKTLLALVMRLLYRYGSAELVQLALVAMCLSASWVSNHFGISAELGAFIAGAMVSHAFSLAMLAPGAGAPAAVGGVAALLAGSRGEAGPLGGAGGGGAGGGGAGGGGGGGHGASGPGHQEPHKLIESLHNVMAALFVASIGLVMSPRFLWDHIVVLTAGAVCVVVVKSLLISCVVRAFGIGYRTSLAVGITMAHIGEFSLVLLSMAMQLKILSAEVYMLLLGVTALSLLTTPAIIMLSSSLLRDRPEAPPGSPFPGSLLGGRASPRFHNNGGNGSGGGADPTSLDSFNFGAGGVVSHQGDGWTGGGGGNGGGGLGRAESGGGEVLEGAPIWPESDAWRRKPAARTGWPAGSD